VLLLDISLQLALSMKSLLSLLVPLSTVAFIPEARLGRPHGLARPVADSQWVHAEVTGDSEGDRKNDEALLAVVPASVNKYEVVMSPAIPFLECPKPLVDCELAGNVGFDPLGLATTKEALLDYREAEVKHGRLAMLVRSPKSRLSRLFVLVLLSLTQLAFWCRLLRDGQFPKFWIDALPTFSAWTPCWMPMTALRVF
jgi:hypothetical protein